MKCNIQNVFLGILTPIILFYMKNDNKREIFFKTKHPVYYFYEIQHAVCYFHEIKHLCVIFVK